MLREFLSLFKTDDAVARMGTDFTDMLDLARNLTLLATQQYFDGGASPEDRTKIFRGDVKVNKMERRLRKQVIAHLTLGGGSHAPYGLLLMSIVKDVERIGDYAKNLAEVYDEGGGPLPDDANTEELREIRRMVETVLGDVGAVFSESNTEHASMLIREGREVSKRCDHLVSRIAAGPYDAATTTTMILGTRYFKRITGHLLNVLSGVVMPLHKLDYYDEDKLTDEPSSEGG